MKKAEKPKTLKETKPTPSNKMSRPIGIYAVSTYLDKPQSTDILSNPNIRGVFLRIRWNTINNIEGQYDWTLIDSEIDNAAKYGKTVSIGISAGENTPRWLEKYTPFLTFEMSNHDGQGKAKAIQLPNPCHPEIVFWYADMLKRLSEHLVNTDRYKHVEFVKINGVNQQTMETRVPYQFNAAEVWKANGYSLTNLLNAWDSYAVYHKTYFPDKYLSLAVIGDPNAGPSINEAGDVIPEKENKTAEKIVDLALRNYGDRLIVQNNALTPTQGTPLDSLIGKTVIGYQEMIAGNKSDQYVVDIVQNAINHGASFVELFNDTIKAYPAGAEQAAKLFI